MNNLLKLLVIITIVPFLFNCTQSPPPPPTQQQPKIKIAVIDTGYDVNMAKANGYPPLKLCKEGHYDFTRGTSEVGNSYPHGTMTASLIAATLQYVDYCAIVYTVFTPELHLIRDSITTSLKLAYQNEVDYVNISITGLEPDPDEEKAVKDLYYDGIMVFAAAGNEGRDLGGRCNSYLTCYANGHYVHSVGALGKGGKLLRTSNYGTPVSDYVYGEILWNGQTVQGTSLATPRALSFYAYLRAQRRGYLTQMSLPTPSK